MSSVSKGTAEQPARVVERLDAIATELNVVGSELDYVSRQSNTNQRDFADLWAANEQMQEEMASAPVEVRHTHREVPLRLEMRRRKWETGNCREVEASEGDSPPRGRAPHLTARRRRTTRTPARRNSLS